MKFLVNKKSGGESGIRTLGTRGVQRFSRPPRSTTPATLRNKLLSFAIKIIFKDFRTFLFQNPGSYLGIVVKAFIHGDMI